MGNPASFATAAATDQPNTFIGAQTVVGALAVTGATTLTGAASIVGAASVAPALSASGTPAVPLTVTAAADTAITAGAESTSVFIDLSASRQFATGALAAQRALRISAPIYRFVGASTITSAVTVFIEGAPSAGTNATITNSYALYVGGGTTRLGGALVVDGAAGVGGAAPASAALAVTSTTQGVLFPRMTETQRDAIAAPAEGLVIYNTTSHKLNVRVAAAWEAITSA